MNFLPKPISVFFACLLLGSSLSAQSEWTALFNEKDLSGWRANDPSKFKVEKGILIGFQNDGKGADLRTEKSYSDFELRFTYKMKWPGNSGIWFRNLYQFDLLDMKPMTLTGAFYYPKCPSTFVWTNKDESIEKKNGWNDGQIFACGNRIAFWLNGRKLGDETLDPSVHRILREGDIGIQVHGGDAFKGMQVSIRSMEIRKIVPGTEPTPPLVGSGGSPLIVAHRGSSYEAPENTLPAFELAWKQGADAVEGDFLLTGDGKIVCFHDKDTKRLTGKKLEVAKTSFADLQKLDVGKWKDDKFRGIRMPLIRDVFATIPKGKKIFVEVKCGPEIVEPLIKEIEKSGLKDDQVVLICFNQDVIEEFKKARPQYKAYWLCRIKKKKEEWTPSVASVLSTLKNCQADGLDSYFATPEEYTQAVMDAGYEWHAWTVNDPQVAKELVGRSISSITTDRPLEIREALQPNQ
jgi:glycerophosphoryl diester phosphodiesterase